MVSKKIQAAALATLMLLPAEGAFARTHHRRHSRTRGAVVGAVVGAAVAHRHPLKGALVGGALGDLVQYERNKH